MAVPVELYILERWEAGKRTMLSPAEEKAHGLARRQMKYRYGITARQYNDMLDEQDGKCAICKAPFLKRAEIDHCHTTGVVRGLLCKVCNMHLGWWDVHEKTIMDYLYEEG